MHLAVHAERLGQVQHLEHRCDAAAAVDPRAQDVAGPAADPLGAGHVLAPRHLRADHRDGELVGQPAVGARRGLLHRLLVPGETQLLHGLAERERLGAAVPVVRVEHQLHVGADGLAHRRARPHVHPHARRTRHRRHPGVQLDRPVAEPDQLPGERRVVLRRRQAAGRLVAAHRAGVGGDPVARAAEHLPQRLPRLAPHQVPEHLVHVPERPVGEPAVRAALPVRHLAPQPFAVPRVLAEQDRPHVLVQHARAQLVRRDLAAPGQALVVGDLQQRLAHLVRFAGVAVPRHVHRGVRGGGEDPDPDRGDHFRSSHSCWAVVSLSASPVRNSCGDSWPSSTFW